MHTLQAGRCLLLWGGIVCVALSTSGEGRAQAQAAESSGSSMSTRERVQKPGWWPTKGTPSRDEFAGPAACAECHVAEAESQPTTPMARTGTTAAKSPILNAHERISFEAGPFVYQIAHANNGVIYSISDGPRSISVPLGWVFGSGAVGQTYIFEEKGFYYESRLSFYPKLERLDYTPGHSRSAPTQLEGALGRQMFEAETSSCFGCHTTAATTSGRFYPQGLMPGVTCEACHGPGVKHVAAMKAGEFERGKKLVLNPSGLRPVDSVDFCGACHRTTWDVLLMGNPRIMNVRFQPYRLAKSPCWGKGDARLTCIACHNPHQQQSHDAASYDPACLRCHAGTQGSQPTSERPGAPCPVAKEKCVECHMPKYKVDEVHTEFTDHYIRIVRPGEPYPD